MPGGRRSMCLNLSCYIATRVVSDSNGSNEFEKKWNELLVDPFIDGSVLQSVVENTDSIDPSSDNFLSILRDANNAFKKNSALVVDSIEKPFAFKAAGWRVIAKLPLAAVAPARKLSDTPVTEGYIMMRDANDGPGVLSGFWMLEFGKGFDLLRAIKDYGDKDAPGVDPEYFERPPGSIRVMHLQESADRWDSETWVYEVRGGVGSLAEHYREHLADRGYKISARVLNDENSILMQFRSDRHLHNIVLYLSDGEGATDTSQIVIQLSTAA